MSEKMYDTSMEEIAKVADSRIVLDEFEEYEKYHLISGSMNDYQFNCVTRLRMIDEGWSQEGSDIHMGGVIDFLMVRPSEEKS